MHLPIPGFIFILSIILLTHVCMACPPDEETTALIEEFLGDKFNQDICRRGIKPGGPADAKWVETKLLPYYLSKKWLTKDPPKGWEKEAGKIIAKCHKNSYNYCFEGDRKKAGDCAKGMAGMLLLKYGAPVMSYCKIFDDFVEGWPTKHKAEALSFFSDYWETKGISC